MAAISSMYSTALGHTRPCRATAHSAAQARSVAHIICPATATPAPTMRSNTRSPITTPEPGRDTASRHPSNAIRFVVMPDRSGGNETASLASDRASERYSHQRCRSGVASDTRGRNLRLPSGDRPTNRHLAIERLQDVPPRIQDDGCESRGHQSRPGTQPRRRARRSGTVHLRPVAVHS